MSTPLSQIITPAITLEKLADAWREGWTAGAEQNRQGARAPENYKGLKKETWQQAANMARRCYFSHPITHPLGKEPAKPGLIIAQGRIAAEFGWPEEVNPFPPGDERREYWQQGWRAVQTLQQAFTDGWNFGCTSKKPHPDFFDPDTSITAQGFSWVNGLRVYLSTQKETEK